MDEQELNQRATKLWRQMSVERLKRRKAAWAGDLAAVAKYQARIEQIERGLEVLDNKGGE